MLYQEILFSFALASAESNLRWQEQDAFDPSVTFAQELGTASIKNISEQDKTYMATYLDIYTYTDVASKGTPS